MLRIAHWVQCQSPSRLAVSPIRFLALRGMTAALQLLSDLSLLVKSLQENVSSLVGSILLSGSVVKESRSRCRYQYDLMRLYIADCLVEPCSLPYQR